MEFNKYYVCDNNGKSNCVIRSFCKMYNKEYDEVLNELNSITEELKASSFNDIEVFEEYIKRHNGIPIVCNNDVLIKNLDLEKGKYLIFCWDKKDYYHMVAIINNVLFDKNDDSLELYPITIYKQMD